jgi:SulP family sulfate permease
MEPKAGIYTAIVAGVVATVFCGSPVQITGPTGSMAVILVGVVAKYGIEKVWIASVMAGIIQIALGVAKLGRLVKFIPYPVIVGFTNGIAVIIFCSQLNDFLGLHLPNQEHFFQALWQTITNLESYNWFAIALAILTIGTKLLWERINQAIPGSLESI